MTLYRSLTRSLFRTVTALAAIGAMLAASSGLAGCGGSKDLYRVGTHGWQADSIYFRVYPTADSTAHPGLPKMSVICKSCNLINPAQEITFDSLDVARIYIPEAVTLLSARLNVQGKGIDTTFIQKQRPPAEAMRFYHLTRPLIGRVIANQFALLYADSTQDSVATSALIGDELNIFAETPHFYQVHHPLFADPLWLLKSNAIRLY